MQHEERLLIRGLHRHEAHRRSRGGLDDRLGVGSVVLPALHKGFDVFGRYEPDFVAVLFEEPRPEGRARQPPSQ